MRSEPLLIWLKPGYLGDAVMATPLLDAVSESGQRPFVLAGRLVRELLADRAERLEFLEALELGSPSRLLRQAAALKSQSIETTLLVNRSFRSALCARMAGIKTRIGHATEWRGMLLSRRVPYPPLRFEAECYLDLARAAGLDAMTRLPKLTITPAEAEQGRTLAAGAQIGIQPGARYEAKRVPLQVMAKVASELIESGRRVVLIGGPDEVEQAASLAALTGQDGLVDLVGRTSLRQTMGVLGGLSAVVGSDTGVMHVAAALGTPTVTVFGPNPVSKWGHQYAPHQQVLAHGGVMASVKPSEILQSVERALAR